MVLWFCCIVIRFEYIHRYKIPQMVVYDMYPLFFSLYKIFQVCAAKIRKMCGLYNIGKNTCPLWGDKSDKPNWANRANGTNKSNEPNIPDMSNKDNSRQGESVGLHFNCHLSLIVR